jgi:asparagine synthase (glutamine-hydrolysing)
MCGICGILNFDPAAPADPAVLKGMADLLAHRGPDGEGFHRDGPLGLGHRRLAIIDLSEAAAHPLPNEDETVWIVFNGEIYNFQALREELLGRGHVFRSKGDTETILHLYEEEGPACVRRLRGMFAFALWDARRRELVLARDRLGVKPLYYWHRPGRGFAFASEPKAFLAHPEFRAEPDAAALHLYLTYQYVPSPRSAFRGVGKVPPAHVLRVRDGQVHLERYWTLPFAPKRHGREADLAEELRGRLEEAVRLRLISDVPLGAFLSGGVDSSAVVALMARLNAGPVKTFSIGFAEPEYDEVRYARRVAARYGTEHHEAVVRPDAVAVLPKLVWHYNEPFADSSAVPSFYLAEMTRRHVTVALNGDGGDEALAGYPRYRAARLARVFDSLPAPVRQALQAAAGTLPAGRAKGFAARTQRFLRGVNLDPLRRYATWMSHFDDGLKASLCVPEFLAQAEGDGTDYLAAAFAAAGGAGAADPLDVLLAVDVATYLPEDLLVKMDIATMAFGLEARSPFLDHEVMEFAAALPPALKLRGGTGKYLLKRACADLLPRDLCRRPKMGFGMPLDHWFRHELRDLAHDTLLNARARTRGLFRPAAVARLLEEHERGRAAWQYQLWNLLVLELWFQTFIDNPHPTGPPPGPYYAVRNLDDSPEETA